jgi:hypothetical protein
LAKVRNPNPKMPDHYDMPLSFQEYTQKLGGNPLEAHASQHGTPTTQGAAHSVEATHSEKGTP